MGIQWKKYRKIQHPERFTPLPTFGELAHWHPLIPDPLLAVEQLPIDREQAKQIRIFLSDVVKSVPHLYAQLPQQLLHRDYDPSNILLDQQHVTAVLDFEFAGKDIRVLDLCGALSWWPVNLLGSGKAISPLCQPCFAWLPAIHVYRTRVIITMEATNQHRASLQKESQMSWPDDWLADLGRVVADILDLYRELVAALAQNECIPFLNRLSSPLVFSQISGREALKLVNTPEGDFGGSA